MEAQAKYPITDTVGHFAEERIMARSLKVSTIRPTERVSFFRESFYEK
jgi:hypothetical protein